MEWIFLVALAWILNHCNGLENDESLSFSSPVNTSIRPTSSFWYGTVPLTLLKGELEFKLHVNKPQGLLFYAIDNQYQTLWAEFHEKALTIKYFNFKSETIDLYSFDMTKLCKLQSVYNAVLHIRFFLLESTLMINCNGNSGKAFYSPNSDSKKNDNTRIFFDEMRNPIPIFNGSSITHIWIGNTPATNVDSYRNTKLESQPEHLLACIQSFSIGGSPIQLVTAGLRYGNMIEPRCSPVCGTNPCDNKVQCVERWRQRFRCVCGLSAFTGKHCNESYSVKFNGDLTINIPLEYKLHNFQIGFTHLRRTDTFQNTKLFSIKFIFNQNLYVYIDSRGYLQLQFTTEDSYNIDATFQIEIKNNRTYILFISVDISGMNFKLADPEYRNVIEQKSISRSLPNLRITKILVGDLLSETMNWMRKFTGCISNLIISDERKSFNWNKLIDLKAFPSCEKKMPKAIPPIFSNVPPRVRISDKRVTPAYGIQNAKVNSQIIPFVIAGIGLLLIIALISVIVIYKYVRSRENLKGKANSPKQCEKVFTYEAVVYQPYSVPNSPPIQYKPPYKAGSFSSTIGKSITSLPSSITATLVTPEDEEC